MGDAAARVAALEARPRVAATRHAPVQRARLPRPTV